MFSNGRETLPLEGNKKVQGRKQKKKSSNQLKAL